MNNNSYWMVVNAEGSDGAPVKVDFLNLKKGALILRALNHKLRQQIIRLLDENKKLTVTEIYVHLRLEQSVASQHLAILRRAGIVSRVNEYTWEIPPDFLQGAQDYDSKRSQQLGVRVLLLYDSTYCGRLTR